MLLEGDVNFLEEAEANAELATESRNALAALIADAKAYHALLAENVALRRQCESLVGAVVAESEATMRADKMRLLLLDAARSLHSYERSYGGGGGIEQARDIATSLGFDGGSDEDLMAWLTAEAKEVA